jgi:hypothetical protein
MFSRNPFVFFFVLITLVIPKTNASESMMDFVAGTHSNVTLDRSCVIPYSYFESYFAGGEYIFTIEKADDDSLLYSLIHMNEVLDAGPAHITRVDSKYGDSLWVLSPNPFKSLAVCKRAYGYSDFGDLPTYDCTGLVEDFLFMDSLIVEEYEPGNLKLSGGYSEGTGFVCAGCFGGWGCYALYFKSSRKALMSDRQLAVKPLNDATTRTHDTRYFNLIGRRLFSDPVIPGIFINTNSHLTLPHKTEQEQARFR